MLVDRHPEMVVILAGINETSTQAGVRRGIELIVAIKQRCSCSCQSFIQP
jgi:hypothetical protein